MAITYGGLLEIFENIKIDPYGFRITCDVCGDAYCHSNNHTWAFQVTLMRPDAITGVIGLGKGGKNRVSRHMVESEVVQQALSALLAYATHEIREGFHYKGRRPFHPHFDVNALCAIDDQVDFRQDTRERYDNKAQR